MQETCLRMSGPVAFTGELILTQGDLRFVPTRKFERLVGARKVRIPVKDIQSVSVVQLGKKLEVQTVRGPQSFLGEGACRVGTRLWGLILERDGKDAGEVGYDSGERVFFSGRVDVLYDKAVAADAELSDRRLRLVARGDAKGAPSVVNIALQEIDSLDFVVSRRELTVSMKEDQTIVFGDPTREGVRDGELVESTEMVRLKGALVPKLYGQIMALGYGESEEQIDESEILLDEDKASNHRGLVVHYGYLALSRMGLNFVPTGKLDGVFGASPVDFGYEDIDLLEVRSNPESRLIVGQGEVEQVFTVPSPMQWFRSISEVLAKLPAPAGSDYNRDGQFKDGVISEKFDDWREHLNDTMTYGVMIAGPSFCWMRDDSLHRGTLILTQTGVLFLPNSGQAESLLHVPIEDVQRSADANEKGEEIVFYAKGVEYRFIPLGGVPFSFMFWARYDQRQKAGKLLDPRTAIRKMKGKTQGLRLSSPKCDVVKSSGLVVPIKGNVGLVIPGGLDRPLEKDLPVTVEVSKGEGLYRFSSSVARDFDPDDSALAQTQENEEGSAQSSAASVLLLKGPGGVYFQNRRGEFRVFYDEIRVRVICVDISLEEQDESAPRLRDCRLLNLSAHGCLLESPVAFDHGTRVLIELPVTIGTIDIPARCVRAVPPAGKRTDYAFGFAFGELREGYRDRIYRIMYRQQGAEQRTLENRKFQASQQAEESTSDSK